VACYASPHWRDAASTTASAPTSTAATPATSSSTAAASPQPAAGIAARLLADNDLRGFTASPPAVNTTARSWVTAEELPPTQVDSEFAKLTRLGFIRGAREDLTMGNTPGLSLFEQFHTNKAARTELAVDTAPASAGPGYKRFAVPGIPGARGFTVIQSGQGGVNVAFAKGPYYYLVGQELATGESTKASIANVIAAAQHLYHRL
jgi:hypothetical protein